MKTFAASTFFALAVLAGCSSSDATPSNGTTPPPGTPDGGGTPIDTSGKLPVPQGNWTKSTNVAHYKLYETRDAAIAWFNDARARDPVLAGDTPVASTDARYAAVDAEVAAIWEGFTAIFARDTEGLPTPTVLLVESAAAGAYAVYDDALGAAPNVFMIQTPTLALGDVALRGVIAHELTHHVLKHKIPGNSDKIERWYDPAKAKGNGFGFEQSDDAAVKDTGTKYVLYALTTGDYPLAQWNGFSRPDANIEYYRTLIHDKAKATSAGPCGEAEAARDALLQLVDPLRSRVTGTLVATADQVAQIDALSKAYVAKETTCATAVPGTLFDVIAADLGNGATAASVRTQASAAEVTANDAASNSYDAIVRLTKGYDAFLLTVDPKAVRYYSFEEQADDMSAAVLLSLAFDPRGMVEYLQKGTFDDKGRTECSALVAAGEPSYGILSDPHHGNCWRIWHATKLIDYVTK